MKAKITDGALAGVEFEVSAETIKAISAAKREAEAEKNAPIFSVLGNRLIVKLTPRLVKTLKEDATEGDGRYISITSQGVIGSCNLGRTWAQAKGFYGRGEAKSIFEE